MCSKIASDLYKRLSCLFLKKSLKFLKYQFHRPNPPTYTPSQWGIKGGSAKISLFHKPLIYVEKDLAAKKFF